MDNEILENGTAPETEELQQPVETQETAEIEQPVETELPVQEEQPAAEEPAQEEAPVQEEQPAAEEPAAEQTEGKKNFTDMLSDVADKGKALIENPKPVLDKIKSVPKKIWMFIGGGVAALIAIIVVLSLLGNTYKTPIKAAEKLLSSKSVNQVLNRAPALLNGFGEDEAETLISIFKKTDVYKENLDDFEDVFEQVIEGLEENVGKNYKIKLKVTDKEKLDKDEVKTFRNQLRNVASLADQLDDMEDDDYADLADDLGVSKAQVKKAVKTLKSFTKECKSAKVQKGYALTVQVTLTGKELDEPTELEIPVNVFKVDGRWVPDVFSLVNDVIELVSGAMLGGMVGLLGGF